jgi:hypothetical protein
MTKFRAKKSVDLMAQWRPRITPLAGKDRSGVLKKTRRRQAITDMQQALDLKERAAFAAGRRHSVQMRYAY